MKTTFVENTPCMNVRDFALVPYTRSVAIDEQTIKIAWKPYKLGFGSWFLCPDCGRRCINLYMKNGWWACRKCHKLYYYSQWLSKEERLLKEYHELLPLLETGKPKWQHESTHRRKMSRFGAIQDILLTEP